LAGATPGYFETYQKDDVAGDRDHHPVAEQEVFLIRPGSDGLGIASFGVVSSHHNYYNHN
jgi:hypothetical protein